MSNAVSILTPVGRLVAGSPFEPNTTDMDGRPLVVRDGVNAGQPRSEYFLAVAVPKSDPLVNAEYAKIVNVARQSFPQLFDASGRCTRVDFAFKVIDGDSTTPDMMNRRPCDREGYAGCWVFKFKNGFAPKVYTRGAASVITNKEELKCGYYVRVYGTVVGNKNDKKPGVFLNCSMIELVGYGEEITFGPSGDQVFGATPAALPPGVSLTPLAPRVPIAQAPATPPVSAALPPVNVTPAPDFLNAPAPVPPPPAPAEEYFIAPNGARVTRTALIGAGWQESQIATLKRG